MKGTYYFSVNDIMMKKWNGIIRNKKDMILILLDTIKYISTMKIEKTNEKGNIVLEIDKMSRIFYCSENKITSFHFPFVVKQNEKGNLDVVYHSTFLLDSVVTSNLIAILENMDEGNEEQSIDDFYSDFLDNIDLNINEKDCTYYWMVIRHLWQFEPGYIRYDYDDNAERVDVEMHPLNHLDICYSGNTTFKLGLEQRIDQSVMKVILDINERSYYIK